jgi:predicted ATP-dependent serine protease
MVLARDQYCEECAATTPHHNGKCTHCERAKVIAEEAAWNSQPTEKKLLDIHRRLKKLERGPVTYK